MDLQKWYALVCDSQILKYISLILGNPIEEKISGSNFFPTFCEYNKNNESIKIFLLGAKKNVAEKAKHNINHKVGRKIIIGAHSPSFGFERDEQECQEIIELINQSDATVLAVGVGAPKQEKWIAKYRHQLPKVKVFMAVGATIDFEAGNLKRSPKYLNDIGLEWLYRLCREPKRLWKRYLVDSLPLFWLVVKQKMNQYIFSPHLQIECLPLGEILQQAGLLSSQNIRQALKIQHQKRDALFGEILVQQGYFSSETINFFVNDLPNLIDGDCKLRLGEYLCRAGLLLPKQIHEALQEQSLTQHKFGEILVRRGWANSKTIDWFIKLQNFYV